MALLTLLISLLAAAGSSPEPSLLVIAQPGEVRLPPSEISVGVVVHELAAALGQRVLTDRDVEALYGAQPASALQDCSTSACYAEVAGALNLRHVISVSVLAWDGHYLLVATVLKAPYAVVALRTQRWFSGPADLSRAAREIAAQIAQHFFRNVTIRVAQWVDVFADGNQVPLLVDQMGRFEVELTYGHHRLRFENPYAQPLEIEVHVGPDSPRNAILVRLQRLQPRE